MIDATGMGQPDSVVDQVRRFDYCPVVPVLDRSEMARLTSDDRREVRLVDSGLCHLLGLHDAKNELLASTLFRKAAELEIGRGRAYWGRCLIEGWGVDRDEGEGLAQLEVGARAGDALCTYFLGRERCVSDELSGEALIDCAAEQGCEFARLEMAMLQLKRGEVSGRILLDGLARGGLGSAQHFLGRYHRLGEHGFKVDESLAMKWLVLAKDQGHPKAYELLAAVHLFDLARESAASGDEDVDIVG